MGKRSERTYEIAKLYHENLKHRARKTNVQIATRKWKRTWGYLSSNSNLQIFSKMLLQKSIDGF